jgi:glycine cleavage system H protein
VAKKKAHSIAAKVRSEPALETILRFSGDHLWVRVDADRGQIGISDYGQERIGEVISVELPDIGDAVEQGEPFGQLESERTLLELIAPVSGTVVAINGELDDQPSLANEDPYHEGWLIEVELDDEAELDALIAAEDYEDRFSKERD